jgi:hypothetical protein
MSIVNGSLLNVNKEIEDQEDKDEDLIEMESVESRIV